MAKTKPIGIRFTDDIVKHFNEVHKVKGHQMMVNYLWTFYAQKAGLLKGSVKVSQITPTENKANYTINTMPLGSGNPVADIAEMEEWKEAAKARIKKLEDDLKYPPSPPPSIGLAMWRKIRENEINVLKKQI